MGKEQGTDKYKTIISRLLPYIVLYVAIFLLHVGMSLDISDDGNFSTILSGHSVLWQLKNVYMKGSGKVLTDTFAAIFTYLPPIIWKIQDSFIYVIIAYGMTYLFTNGSDDKKWMSCIIMLYFPMDLLLSAGYCTTSTNYTWTAASVLIALFPIKKIYNCEYVKMWEWILYIASIVYAGSQEQSALLVLGAYTVVLIYGAITGDSVIKLRMHRREIVICWLISILMLLIMLTSPGHCNKSILTYSMVAVPDYPTLNIVDKLHLGFTTTMAHFISQPVLIMIVMCGCLFILVIKRRREIMYRAIGIIPLIISLCVSVFGNFTEIIFKDYLKYFHYVPQWAFHMVGFYPINASDFDNIKAYIPTVTAMIFITSVIACIFICYGFSKKTAIIGLIFVAGLLSRVIMAFSYTLYGSDTRTFSYFYVALMSMCLIFAGDIVESLLSVRKKVIVYTICCIGAIVVYVNSCIGIWSNI